MTQPFGNMTNMTPSFEGFVHFDNQITEGYYTTGVVFTVFMIVLLATGMFLKSKGFVVASFTGFITALFFWAMGELAFVVVGFMTALLVASFLIMAYLDH